MQKFPHKLTAESLLIQLKRIGPYLPILSTAILLLTSCQETTLPPSIWNQADKIIAEDVEGEDNFGNSVSISSDGKTFLVAGILDDDQALNAGAAYVYVASGTDGSSWREQAKLTASDGGGGDYFGKSMSLSANGQTALIGAYGNDQSPNKNAGAAYIFKY